MGRSFLRAVLISGFIVGAADIFCACASAYIQHGTKPSLVLEYVASGVFGTDAFGGGIGIQLMGLLFHFIIAYALTLVFFWVRPSSSLKIFTGVLYGCFVWVVTNLLIVPLSKVPAPKKPFDAMQALLAAGILIVAIGIPLVFLADAFYRNRNKAG